MELRAAARNFGVTSSTQADGFGFAAIDAGDFGGFQQFEISFARFGGQLAADVRAVEAGLRQQEDAVEHVGELVGAGVRGAFAFGGDAEDVAFRFAGDADPLQLIEQRRELRRLQAARGVRGECGVRVRRPGG